MKRLVIILIAVLCSFLLSCNKTSETQCTDFDLQEKATSSVLLKGLDKFNYDLSTKRNIPRIYDYKSDSINHVNVTRINWRQFWLADAAGAWQGGRSGFTYGCAFSPSGAIAGAIVGGLLCGAISSGIDYWVQRAPRMESSLINDLVQSNEIFNPEILYNLYTEITEKKSITLKEIDDSNTISIKIDTIYHVVGKAHNVLLEKLIETKDSLKKITPSSKINRRTLSANDYTDNSTSFYIDDINIFQNDFSAQMVSSEIFKRDFSSLVKEQIQKSESGILFDEANSISEYVMNLFLEASLFYTNEANDIDKIVNYYYNTIKPSTELSEEEKTALYIGMVVASYSSKYWEKCEN